MTFAEAHAALNVPAHKANNNCVQDAQWRLRDALKLAARMGSETVPSYVARAVTDLQSWVDLK